MSNRFAVLDNETGAAGKVINIALADEPLNGGWLLDPPANVQIGFYYDGEGAYSAPLLFTIADQVITVNGLPVQFFAGNYYCQPGDSIQLQGNIKDANGDTVTSINVPVTLKMPIVRHANGKPTDDEEYLNVTLQNGVITATGSIQRSGDWKILIERNNDAIERIGANWKLKNEDITFLA